MRTSSPFGEFSKLVMFLLCGCYGAWGQLTPLPGSPIPAGSAPSAVAAADFDGNGIQDLAIADYATGKLTVLLGNASGQFLPAKNSPFTVGSRPVSIAVFMNGGKPSLAVANEGADSVSILNGDGAGGFTVAAPIQLTAGSAPVSVAAGNFARNPGLAIANFASGTVSLWTANSSGTFAQVSGSPFTVGPNPSSVTIGDFNGDGVPDFASANKRDGTISVYLSNGSSGYAQAAGSPFAVLPQDTNAPSVAYPSSIVAADFNADGVLDLAVANEGTNNVSVFLGNGAGGFGPTIYTNPIAPASVGSSPFALAVGYFNADIYPDLVVVNVGDNTVDILLGSATGAFTMTTTGPIPVGILPESVAIGYFTATGLPGLAVANKGSNTVTVLSASATGPVTVSGASLVAPVAPGSAISIFGAGLATSATAGATLPNVLGGSSVVITDYTGVQTILPLISTSATQINAVIPPSVNAAPNAGPVPPPPAILTVYTATGAQSSVLPLVSIAPGLFSANNNGKGVAQALFGGAQGGSPVYTCPIGPGSCVATPIDLTGGGSLTLYGTGIRGAGGSATVNFAGSSYTAAFAGPVSGASGDKGTDQVTVNLPAGLRLSGLVEVSVTAGGKTSNVVNIAVQ